MRHGSSRKRPAGKSGESLRTDSYEAEDILAGAEPWSPIETKLVVWSFIAAAISLVGFGIVINLTILAN